jgi:hypothetical protein
MNVPTAITPKRPYQSPRLIVYGTIREITGNTGNTSMSPDGSMFFHTKTS